jgi:hypothetical protein
MAEVEFRVATEYSVVKVKITPEGKERSERLASENRCLGCEEIHDDGGKIRCGLCDTCYQGVQNAAKKKRISKSKLIASGHMFAPGKGGRKPKNAFTRSLGKSA